jgi:hypothetical protein
MRWPVRAKRQEPAAPSLLAAPTVTSQPSPPQVPDNQQPSPAEPEPFQRPDNIYGLVSDLGRFPRQSVTLALAVLLLVGGTTLFMAGGVWAIVEATKGLKVGALPTLFAAIPGASVLAFLTSRFMRFLKKWGKGGDGPSAR